MRGRTRAQEAQITRLSDAGEQWVLTAHSEPQQKVWQSQEASKWKSEASIVSARRALASLSAHASASSSALFDRHAAHPSRVAHHAALVLIAACPASQLASELLVKQGLEVGRVELLMHVRVCRGYTQHLDGTLQKMYSQEEVAFPLQCVLRARPGAPPPAAQPAAGAAPLPPADGDAPKLPVLAPGDRAVFLGKGLYGALAVVLPDLGAGMAKTGKPLRAGTGAPSLCDPPVALACAFLSGGDRCARACVCGVGDPGICMCSGTSAGPEPSRRAYQMSRSATAPRACVLP